MIRENLGASVIGRAEKLAAGLIYAETVADAGLDAELRALGAREQPGSPVQALALAISPSPALADRAVVESSRAIQPAGIIIELVSFVGLLQLLHRLPSFIPAAAEA